MGLARLLYNFYLSTPVKLSQSTSFRPIYWLWDWTTRLYSALYQTKNRKRYKGYRWDALTYNRNKETNSRQCIPISLAEVGAIVAAASGIIHNNSRCKIDTHVHLIEGDEGLQPLVMAVSSSLSMMPNDTQRTLFRNGKPLLSNRNRRSQRLEI